MDIAAIVLWKWPGMNLNGEGEGEICTELNHSHTILNNGWRLMLSQNLWVGWTTEKILSNQF